jgi:hypothetical protein
MATDTALPESKQTRARRNNPPGAEDGAVISAVRTKPSWKYGFGAIALVIVGGLISLFLYMGVQHSTQIFVVNTNVTRGQTIQATELGVIDVAPNQHVTGFTQASDIVGKVATVDLPKGSLVTPSAIASKLPVPEGKALVGIPLKQSQLPSVPLRAGDRVVITPIAAASGSVQEHQSTPSDVTGTVATSSVVNPSTGLTVVNVYVSQSAASDVAGRAAAGLVTVYVDPEK